MTNDLVKASQIASRLNVPLNLVHKWRSINKMPAPVYMLGSHPLWSWADVLSWARRTGRVEQYGSRVSVVELESLKSETVST